MTSDAELRMMMMMNTMDLEQEAGPLSSEDRLFMGSQGSQGRTQQQAQVEHKHNKYCITIKMNIGKKGGAYIFE